MRFNYVRFKNFLSYGDEITTIKLYQTGVTFVSGENRVDGGSNGSGKSVSVVDSIVYALFGKTTKKLKADEVINNINKKDCFVEISFNINEDNYIIRRYRKHNEFGNELVIEKNGIVLANSDQKRDAQKLIESIIKISFKSFVLSVVLSQEKVANFTEVDILERKRIIENLLMYDFISKYHKATKQIMRTIRPQIEKFNSQYNDKNEVVKTLTKNLEKYVEKFENQIKEKKKRIEELKVKIEECKNLNLTEELENRNELKSKEQEFISLNEKIDSIYKYLNEINLKKKKIQKEKKEKEEKLNNYLGNPEKCPLCGNSINTGKFEKFIKEKKDDITLLNNDLNELIEKEKEMNKKFSRKEKKVEVKKEEIKELKLKINNKINESDINNLKERITSSESEITVLSSQLEADIEKDEYVISIIKKIDEVKDEIKQIRRKVRKLKEELIYYEWWKDALSNSPNSLKSYCINHILKSLNKYINYYLSFFKYDMCYTLDENLEDHIIKDKEETTFAHLSRGEKRSIEISLMFALYEIIRLKLPDSINIIVLDELLSNFLDDIRIGGALTIIQELEARGFDIFIIEHKELIKESLMCNTINIVKEKNGFSVLEKSDDQLCI